MHYFIVRSEALLQDTITRFKQKYACVDGFSVTDIQYLQPSIDFSNYRQFVFTSQYAANALGKIYRPRPDDIAYCIGSHTKKMAENAGFNHIYIPENAHSERLFDLISKKKHTGELLYLAGKYRKPTLENLLVQHKISYKVIELYAAEAHESLSEDMINKIKNIQDMPISMVCFSKRTADVCYALLKKHGLDHLQYCWHIIDASPKENCQFAKVVYYATPEVFLS